MNDPASDSARDRPAPTPSQQVIEGAGASPGIAIGTVYRYRPTLPAVEQTHVDEEEVEDQLRLLDEAFARARDEFNEVRSVAQNRLGEEGDAIFEAQELMLDDGELRGAIRSRIRNHHETAAHALSTVLRRHRERIENSADAYLRDRSGDLDELEGRLLRALVRGTAVTSIEPRSIVVADRLTAADIIRFSRSGMVGCVTARGGTTSHVSIIARALHLPAIVGVDGVTEAVASRAPAIVDGRRGRLIVHPTPATLERYQGRRTSVSGRGEGPVADAPPETADGCRITLQANVEFAETLDVLDEAGAEGIGLMRTEMLSLGGREAVLTEENQESIYRRAASITGEHGATVRLLDLGGDKLRPVGEPEDNPVLGWRGIRVLLDRPDEFLRPQIRALLRANVDGTLRVLLPMVTEVDEVRRVQAVIDEEAARLSRAGEEHDPDLSLGVMVEVPAVALQAEVFAENVDFLSVGTNDLTQYVLAVDRGNEHVADRFDALHPAVLGLVRKTVKAGQTAGTPVSLCGEIAGDIYALPILIGLGLTTFSMAPASLSVVKPLIGRIDRQDAEELAAAACASPDASTVRALAKDWFNEHVSSGLGEIDGLFLEGDE